ncbi:MxaK protein [Salinisphaera sp. T5B8]|uniref:hypothetical protein n=1 Tax=Salinisphaera sp. T5B8 TaxID=1304154 RepID=UPI00333E4AC4
MSRSRLLEGLALTAAACALAVTVWQGLVWYDHARDQSRIAAALAHQKVAITPDTGLQVLFAEGYAQARLRRYREASAAYRAVWNRTYGADGRDPDGLAARSRYNLGNLYARRSVAAAQNLDIDSARTMAELAKQAYRDALRAAPDYWPAKHNFEAAQRLVRDLPTHEGEAPTDAEAKPDVWSQMPGFPRGLP